MAKRRFGLLTGGGDCPGLNAAMRIGLVGLAGSGKTTVFNAVTGLEATVGLGGGDRLRPNLGVTKVPDPRVDRLAELYPGKEPVYVEVTFVDLPGKMPGSAADGLDPQAVQHIRDMDALALVVRAFDNPSLADPTDPVRDLAALEDELLLTDLVVVERRLERLRKEGKPTPERVALERCRETLDGGEALRLLDLSAEDRRLLAGYGFLSRKPALALLDVPEEAVTDPPPPGFVAEAERRRLAPLVLSGQVEMEIAHLDPEDQADFLADLGLEGGAPERFVHAAWSLLDTISFLTIGDREVRAWEIRRGTPALRAAGKVHTDIERGFIRAEVIPFEELSELGSEQACKEKGRMRLEGKEYVVRDGDVVRYRFNV